MTLKNRTSVVPFPLITPYPLARRLSAVWVLLAAASLVAVPTMELAAQNVGLSGTPQRLQETISQAGSTISFSNQVAPLLTKHCGNCHIRSSKGDFNMANFARLSAASGVVVPGNPGESKLVSMVQAGEMPPKGQVPAAELTMISKWIESGAAFDGNDRNASLTMLSGSGQTGASGSSSGAPGGGYGSGSSSGAPGGGYGSGSSSGAPGGGYGSGSSSGAPGGGYGSDYGSGAPGGGYGSDYGSGAPGGDYGSGYGSGSSGGPPDGGYGGGYGGRRSRRSVAQLDAELTYLKNFKAAIGDVDLSSILAPASSDLGIDTGPVLKREAEQAFAMGNYPLALELMFGHLAAEYPDSLVDLRTVKFSTLLKRPVWNIRFGVSMSIRGPSVDNPDPIRVTTTKEEIAAAREAGRGRGGRGGLARSRGGYGEESYGSDEGGGLGYDMEMEEEMEEDMGYGESSGGYGYGPEGRGPSRRRAEPERPKRTMLDPEVAEQIDRTLGLVAEVVRDEFKKRFQDGDFGPALTSVQPPPPEVDNPIRNRAVEPTAETEVMTSRGPAGPALLNLLDQIPEPEPMWTPGVMYLGEAAASTEVIPLAKKQNLDVLIHFDVILKESRIEMVQNISRCRLIHIDSGKTIVVSKGFDNREAAQMAEAARMGEREYVDDGLANFLAVMDEKVAAVEFPRHLITAEVAKKRLADLMKGSATPSLRTLAEIRLYQALDLINDAEAEIAFGIIGGPDALLLLHGPEKDRAEMVHRWAARSLGGQLAE